MAQHKLRSRIAQFKQPFLLGAVTSAALLGGCGGETQGSGVNPGGQSGMSDECPSQAPAAGKTCSEYEPGLDCGYGDESSCSREFTCNDGNWQDVSPTCNPPPPELFEECPVKTPSIGQTCSEYEPGLDCTYDDESSCPREFKCNDGNWQDVSPTCNPPPPELIEECPVKTPSIGQTCSEYEPGLDCAYDDESSCPREFKCNDGAWENRTLPCNPPPPESECPEQLPRVGDSCEGYEQGLECESEVADTSCPEANTLYCGASGEWEGPIVICNPPPPEPLVECPTELPIPGDSCDGYQVGLTCEHLAPCDGGVGAVCGAEGVWEAVTTFCNPPPVIETDSGIDSTEPDGG